MSDFNSYDRTKQLAELAIPYDIGSGMVSAATQRATLLTNMGITASLAQLNAIPATTASAAEINVLTGVTAGTVTASKALVVDANKDIGVLRYLKLDVSTGLTAAGTTQATGLQLVKSINNVTVGATTTGVNLPAAATGMRITVINSVANTIHVYPVQGGSETINGIAAGTGVVQAAGSTVNYYAVSASAWIATELNLQTQAAADALTAVGTTQATGLQLTSLINRVTVGASTTGVNLPASAPGLAITIINAVANSIHVYPVIGGTETINGIAAATGVIIQPGTAVTYFATAAGVWTTVQNTQTNGKYTTRADTVGFTAAGSDVAGADEVILNITGALGAGANLTLPTVASLLAAIANPIIGETYYLRVANTSSANFAWTVTTNTGWTLNGTMTVAQNTYREFICTITSVASATATLQSINSGVQNAV